MRLIKNLVRKTLWTIHKRIRISTPVFRYILSFAYDKELYKLKNEEHIFAKIYDSDFWGSPESKSGAGSTMKATQAIREHLPALFCEYSIKSIIDVPCGDYNWMRNVDKSSIYCYIGGDIVPQAVARNNELYADEKISFRTIDITKDDLPKVDLIFCRDCLEHLSQKSVIRALNNFKRSGSTFLLTSNHPKTWRNHDIYDGDYRALNLHKTPFSYPKPLKVIVETKDIGNESDKNMSLYRLSDVPYINSNQ